MAVKGVYLRLTISVVLFCFCQVHDVSLATDIKAKRSACGGNIFSDSGVLQSPNYPNNYGTFERCQWVITVPEDYVVKLTFRSFEVEQSDYCQFDYVKVYNGRRTSSTLLGTFCGRVIPRPIQSSGNTLSVDFRSDGSGVYSGFSAEFTKVGSTTVTECSNPRSPSSVKWLYHQSYCYNAYIGEALFYSEAKEFCNRNGAHLASIHSSQEMSFIHSLVREHSTHFWIGLRKEFLSEYKWEDGTPVDYLNWAVGDNDDEDYDSSLDEDSASGLFSSNDATCTSFQAPEGSWDKSPCYSRYHVICKYKNDSDTPVTATSASLTTLPGFCPDGWYTFGNKCYKLMGQFIMAERKPWSLADNQCKQMGSNLVSIHSTEEQDFLNTRMMEMRYKTWTGLRRPNGIGAFAWSDNSPLDFVNWNTGEPNNHLGTEENCVQMLYSFGVTGKWNDVPCNLRFPYICQMSIDPTITEPGIDPSVCTDPEGWQKIRTSCYKVFYDSGSHASWSEAQSFCEGQRANLATVKNLMVTTDLRTHLDELEGYFWIGISSSAKHRYSWVGAAPLIYTNWQNDQPRDVSNGTNCVATNTEGKWMVRNCNESLPFICEVNEALEVPTLEPHPHNMTCPKDSPKWHDFGGQYCYIIEVSKRLEWYEASCRCTGEGGFLASFHSTDEVNVILHHLKDFEIPVHIGFERNRNGRFVWSDGSPTDFENWKSKEPTSTQEQCAEMNSETGKWSDIQCGERSGYICSTLKVPEVEVPTKSSIKGEYQLTAGLTSLIAICVIVVLVALAVALYHFHPSMKKQGDDRVPFANLEQ